MIAYPVAEILSRGSGFAILMFTLIKSERVPRIRWVNLSLTMIS